MHEYSGFYRGFKYLIFVLLKLLNVDSVDLLLALYHRRLRICLTATEFFNHTCFFEFTFELLQRPFNVFAFLNGYYYHDYLCLVLFFAAAKLR